MLRLRPLGPGDDDAVRELFRSTIGPGGSPLSFVPAAWDQYQELCLGWYLGPERRHARVLEGGDGDVVGYVLVGTDAAGQRRWSRPRCVAYAAHALLATALRSPGDPGRVFARLRVRDGLALRNAPRPMPVHAHLNLHDRARGTLAALVLVDHADAVSRRMGAPGWYGEVNARVGRRAAGLERVVGPVVHRMPNLTYTWLARSPMERLTVVRHLPSPAPACSAEVAARRPARAGGRRPGPR